MKSKKVLDETQYNETSLTEKLKEQGLDGSNINDFQKSILGEDIFEFYYGKDNAADIHDLLADSMSQKRWKALLEKHKDGKVSSEDMVDILMVSQVHAQERSNPISSAEEIVDRAMESKLKGRLGQKLIAATINCLSEKNLLTAPKEAVKAFITHQSAKSDVRAIPTEDQKFLPTEMSMLLNSANDEAYAQFQNSLNVNDLIRDITKEELIGRLGVEDDPYFDASHHIIFDMGWESATRTDRKKQFLSIYVCELDKAWTDTIESNLKKDTDRHITRYILRDVEKGDLSAVNQIRDKIMEVYYKRFQEKIDFFVKKLW